MPINHNTVTTQLYINGQYQNAVSGETYPQYNPARPSELVGYAANATVADVDLACNAARDAMQCQHGRLYPTKNEPNTYLRLLITW